MSPLLNVIFSDLAMGLGFSLLATAGCLLLSDEFRKFKAAKAFFWLAAMWIAGRIIMWSVFTSESFVTRAIVTFIACGILGIGLAESLRATNNRANSLPVGNAESPKTTASIEQHSSGSNSPNANIPGNENKVTINLNAVASLPQPAFHEDSDSVSVVLGGNPSTQSLVLLCY
jgi:hypothetical protein